MPQLSLIRLIRIEAVFGSDVQHDVSLKVLREFLEAWKMNVQSAHKKNKITIDYGREPDPR
jgi:hypothetical protein